MTEVRLFLILDQISSKDINQNAEKNERGQKWVSECEAHGQTGINNQQPGKQQIDLKKKWSRDEDTRGLSQLDTEEENNL